ncbi:hypothetical protein JCM11641_004292 [Rhodosporidiobolus odoratus]
MSNRTIDDADSSITYTGPWESYKGESGTYNASAWLGGTFTSCGGNNSSNSTGCQARFTFTGTRAALYGDTNAGHGVFSCRLEREIGDVEEPEGLWGWWFAGSQSNRRPYRLNAKLCQIEGIPAGQHTLVLGVEPDQVERGIAIDYLNYTDSVPAGSNYLWSSDFNGAVPPTSLRNTTATPTLPSATSSPSPSSPPSSNGINTPLAVGLGAGLGGACALLALGVAVWLILKRRRARKREPPPARHEASRESASTWDAESNWFPGRTDVNTMQGSPIKPLEAEKARSGDFQGFEESPPSTYGFGSSRAGYAPVKNPSPYPYPATSAPQYSYDHYNSAPSAFPPSNHPPSTSSPPLSSLHAPSPIHQPPQRASIATSGGRSSRDWTSTTFLDLPHDATLADPDDFHERR